MPKARTWPQLTRVFEEIRDLKAHAAETRSRIQAGERSSRNWAIWGVVISIALTFVGGLLRRPGRHPRARVMAA